MLIICTGRRLLKRGVLERNEELTVAGLCVFTASYCPGPGPSSYSKHMIHGHHDVTDFLTIGKAGEGNRLTLDLKFESLQ